MKVANIITKTTFERVQGISKDGEIYFDCYPSEIPNKYYDVHILDMYNIEEFGQVVVMELDL